MKALIGSGASVSYRSPTGCTPLIKAVGCRNTETVRLLIEAKADLAETTNSGLSPMMIAEEIRDQDMLVALRSYIGA